MTRKLHLLNQGEGPTSGVVLRVKTETGHTCDIPLAPQFAETVRTFIGEEEEERGHERETLRKHSELIDRLDTVQGSHIAQILELAPNDTPVHIVRAGLHEDTAAVYVKHHVYSSQSSLGEDSGPSSEQAGGRAAGQTMSYATKPITVTAATFAQLFEHAKISGAKISDGMPWEFTFEGHSVWVDRDQMFRVSGPIVENVPITPSDVLVIREDGLAEVMNRLVFEERFQPSPQHVGK